MAMSKKQKIIIKLNYTLSKSEEEDGRGEDEYKIFIALHHSVLLALSGAVPLLLLLAVLVFAMVVHNFINF
jgi:hypothetical protein